MLFKKAANGSQSVTYELKSPMGPVVAEALAGDIRQDIAKEEKYAAIIFDFRAYDMDFKAFKTLSPLGLELRKINSQMYALTENKAIHSQIRQEGLTKILKPITNLSEVPGAGMSGAAASSAPASSVNTGSAKKATTKLDVSFVNPFVDGTIEVLGVQCQLKAIPLKPLLKGDTSFQCQTDIAGIIGITSQSFQGNIAICFPADVFLKIMSNMLGETFTEINDDLTDGAAELTNMIFGHAKRVLNENGHTIEKALPSVVRGPNLKIDHSGSHDSIILPFTLEDSKFFMEIAIEQN